MKLKNLTKKLTTLAITALMATTLVSTQIGRASCRERV